MNESFLAPLFARVGGPRQAAIIAVGVAVTALVFGVSRWATRPTMVPLFADIPVEQVKPMTDKLAESGIAYELDASGSTILVASGDLARARVDLAAEVMPSATRPGLELFDKPSWGMTDFTQKVNYRRALEGELERTIGKMQDVEAVQVHLALEETPMFRETERPSKASVTLRMLGGQQPTAETVRGIASLVAGSVGGLQPEHVTVVDARGQALTSADDGSPSGLTSRQLSVQREVEGYLEAKADKLISSLVGAGNARVQVAASVNFNKVERTTQAVDPERQAMASEQKAEVTPSTPQQGAGYATSTTAYENTRSVENFTGAIGNVTRLTVAVLVADKVTWVPDTAAAGDSTAAGAAGAAGDSTADSSAARAPAPLVPLVTARTPEELARIETLVRTALGVDSTRGDVVSVVSAPFDMPAPIVRDSVPAPQDFVSQLQANPKPVVAVAALVVLLVFGLVVMRMLRGRPAVSTAAAAITEGSAALALPPAPTFDAFQVPADPAALPAVAGQMPAFPQPSAMAPPQLGAGTGGFPGFPGMEGAPAPEWMDAAQQGAGGAMSAPPPMPRQPLVLPPQASTPERDQAIATIEQRPDAAIRVIRSWLRS
ncbi:MAG: flagellar M-ring protein [Gemmatimonadota bacterium]|jgi:flagellar M-ring protein FliF